jgi:uncharacterized alkaline shock family protein YloU
MVEIKSTGEGAVVLNNDVLVGIAATAAKETEGVHGLATTAATFRGELRQRITRKAGGKGVLVKIEGNAATVTMHIIARMGVQLQDVAKLLQQRVKNAIENMTGLSVTGVHVVISGIAQKKTKPA